VEAEVEAQAEAAAAAASCLPLLVSSRKWEAGEDGKQTEGGFGQIPGGFI